MRLPAKGLARLLALLLLLQWGAATGTHARELAALGDAMRVELCSGHGTRSLLVDRDGQPIGQDAGADCCDLSPIPLAAPPPAPAAVPVPVAHPLPAASPARPGLPPLPPRAPPQLPRAPPAA